jgi:dTDP-4-amino-4,6-dideoxygalactose transaminase
MTFKIPLFKVNMSPRAGDLVADVLQSGQIAEGPKVQIFEYELEKALGAARDQVVSVNSGTSALHLAYHLANIRPGDVVIATPMTCAATITPLVHLGAEIVWADVDMVSGHIDPRSVAELVEIYTDPRRRRAGGGPLKAVVAVDWAGTPAPYEDLRRVVPEHIPIIEDAAHAFGATRQDGTPLAAAAACDNLFVCYSFQAIKHLTCGDGGALVCPSPEITDRARKLRWFGLDRRSKTDFRAGQDIDEAGYKFHMNDIAATIGLANLDVAQAALVTHRANASAYFHAFCDKEVYPRITPPPLHPGSSWWLYTILVEDRQGFQRFMFERGIETSQVHRRNDEHPAFPMRSPVSLSGLDHFATHQVSIPVGSWVSPAAATEVIDAVRSWAQI